MLTTVFKDKVPKGISYPLPLEFLKRALSGAVEKATALYFVHGSLWVLGKHNVSEKRLHEPRVVLYALKARPMFRNNNQKVAVDVEDYDWHFVLRGMPSESRHILQKQFEDIAAEPLARWLVDHKPRSSSAHIWWYLETRTMSVDFS